MEAKFDEKVFSYNDVINLITDTDKRVKLAEMLEVLKK